MLEDEIKYEYHRLLQLANQRGDLVARQDTAEVIVRRAGIGSTRIKIFRGCRPTLPVRR